MTSGCLMKLTIATVILSILTVSPSQGDDVITSCVYDEDICGCQSNLGPIDLSSYRDNGVTAEYSTASYTLTATWNPCHDFAVDNITGAVILDYETSNNVESLGLHNTTSTSVLPYGSVEFTLDYYDSDGATLTTNITCICQDVETDMFEFADAASNDTSVSFNDLVLYSSHCCPFDDKNVGLTNWEILLIVLISVVAAMMLYLFLGVLYLLLCSKEDVGVTWTAVWCYLPLAFERCCCGRKQTYEQI